MMRKRVLVIGAGFSGAVVARRLANDPNTDIHVIDKREHVAGNCHTERCPETGVMQHVYGAHIFHTSSHRVWKFVNEFADFRTFINNPFARYDGALYSLPINLSTFSKFFDREFTPESAKRFLENELQRHDIEEPRNFEEQGLRFLGDDLYYAFFYGYTKKQWGREPRDLSASILKRLPVRFTYNSSYYSSVYQGIPAEGYTALVERILEKENIQIFLRVNWRDFPLDQYDHVVVTSPLDEFFGYDQGRLRYRTVYWEKEIEYGDRFGHAAINYPGLDVSCTRQREHKHYCPWEHHDKTVIFTEYSKETEGDDDPYYPLSLPDDKVLCKRYMRRALELDGYTFLGRLATYRYLDMHQVIQEALEVADRYLESEGCLEKIPTFHENVRARVGL